jgi:general secretion pathway protein C
MVDLSAVGDWQAKLMSASSYVSASAVKIIISAMLVVSIGSALGELVWQMVPAPDVKPIVVKSPSTNRTQAHTSNNESMAIDLPLLQSWNWFGKADPKLVEAAPEPEKVPAVDETQAVKTRLNLTLRGVAMADDQAIARAMIESGSKQENYKVGDKVKVSGNVTLAKVLADRVILDNSGRLEALFLYDQNMSNARSKMSARQSPKQSKQESVIDRRGDDSITKMASDYKRQLLENPTSLADVIRISISKNAEGEINGYKIRPGKHRKQFTEFGFKSGDVVTAINGIELIDPTKALEVYRMLREATEASFSVNRGNEDLTLIVGLGE